MKTVRIGVLSLCAAVGAGGYLSPRGTATDEPRPAQAAPARSSFTASDRRVGLGAEPALDSPAFDPARSVFEPAASDSTPPPRTLDVHDALNADIGAEGEYVDPDTLADVLRSDPELARLLNQ
jgi:hypothetical protein